MPRALLSWKAFCHLTTWTDGSGGFDHGALEAWFERRRGRLTLGAVADVRRFVPILIAEDRAITREELDRRFSSRK